MGTVVLYTVSFVGSAASIWSLLTLLKMVEER